MTQIENGMIGGAEKYDPQCQDVKMQRCTVCHKMWPQGDLTYYAGTGDWVCPDCRMQYLREQGADFVEGYIESHPADYYIGWWWAGLTESEKLRSVKKVYWETLSKSMKIDPIIKDRVEFCEWEDGFTDYVEAQIK